MRYWVSEKLLTPRTYEQNDRGIFDFTEAYVTRLLDAEERQRRYASCYVPGQKAAFGHWQNVRAERHSMYYTYLLRCKDGSLYVGITTDLIRRFREHQSSVRGAKYTRSHPPLRMEAAWTLPDRAAASKLEYALKRRSHGEKEAAIRDGIPGYTAVETALLPKEEAI